MQCKEAIENIFGVIIMPSATRGTYTSGGFMAVIKETPKLKLKVEEKNGMAVLSGSFDDGEFQERRTEIIHLETGPEKIGAALSEWKAWFDRCNERE